jgi:tetratricopeptide (TPR) repeat protein
MTTSDYFESAIRAGDAAFREGRYDQGKELLLKAVDLAESEYGAASAEYIQALGKALNAASMIENSDEVSGAASSDSTAVLRRRLADLLKQAPVVAPDVVVWAWEKVGLTAHAAARYAEAEQALREALELHLEKAGPGPRAAHLRAFLVMALVDSNDGRRAIELCDENLSAPAEVQTGVAHARAERKGADETR